MLQKFLKDHPNYHDAYCVDTGGVLSAYGLRNCSDFDLILDKNFEAPFIDWGLNNFTREKYGYNIDELLYNPRHHFYHKGIRFVSLAMVLEFKSKKGNQKDLADINLIQKFLFKCTNSPSF
jgi:hypothetical protein